MGEIEKEITYLLSLISENKRDKIRAVIAYRTHYVTVVLENILQPHNASAAIRSCDIFGVQDLHVVEQEQSFTPQNAIAKGANKWIDIYRYPTTKKCIQTLKTEGYRIVATTPHKKGYILHDVPLNQKIALLFGTEVIGLSDEALSLADDFVTIPMFGFTESFNISVSVALCLYHIMWALHTSDVRWQLTEDERQKIELGWLKKILHMDRG